MSLEISSTGLKNAFLQTSTKKRKDRERIKIIAWCHLLRWYMMEKRVYCAADHSMSKQDIFKIMNTARSQLDLKRGLETCTSDEVPTPWMVQLYREFEAWAATQSKPRKKK